MRYISAAISPVKPAAPLPSLPVVPKKAPPPAPKKEKKTYTVIALYHFQRAESGDLSLVEVYLHFQLNKENGVHT